MNLIAQKAFESWDETLATFIYRDDDEEIPDSPKCWK